MYRDEKGELRERSIYRPRIAVKTIDSKRHLIGFRSPKEIDDVHLLADPTPGEEDEPARLSMHRGSFLDLRTLAFVLTDESYTLRCAGEEFGVETLKRDVEEHGVITEEYIDYNRDDVKSTGQLFAKLMDEYRLHDLDLPAAQAFSPASLGKAYLRKMGIRPILARQADFDRDVLGYAMGAYYGGRAECRIRRTEVPVVYCDFLSMYPTVNSLMGLWDLLTAETIEVKDATGEIQAFLDDVTFEECFNPTMWRQLPALVEIQPDGDMLPVRADYAETGKGWQIGLNPLRSDRPLWYTLPDLVVSKILTGRTPTIIRALKLVPSDRRVAGLRPVKLRGATDVDPRRQDLFRTVIEERKALPDDEPDSKRLDKALKVLANATSYGIFAEIVRRELGGDEGWWSLADVIAAKLEAEDGQPPTVTRAIRFTPGPVQNGMRPIDIAGQSEFRIDPYRDDFIQRLIELRSHAKTRRDQAESPEEAELWDAIQHGLKITANSDAYGIGIEINTTTHRKPQNATLHYPDGTATDFTTKQTEHEGPWFNPLIATLTAAGGRLLLATLIRLVHDAGRDDVFCDTDSLFISGLDWQQIQGIVDIFELVNPYDPHLVPGSILKIENINYDPLSGEPRSIYCYSVASKRYAIVIRLPDGTYRAATERDASGNLKTKLSEHGLGHLQAPSDDFEAELWEWIINTDSGHEWPDPEWFDQPALGRTTINTPHDLQLLRRINHDKPYREQIRPGNFLTLAHAHPIEQRGLLVAP